MLGQVRTCERPIRRDQPDGDERVPQRALLLQLGRGLRARLLDEAADLVDRRVQLAPVGDPAVVVLGVLGRNAEQQDPVAGRCLRAGPDRGEDWARIIDVMIGRQERDSRVGIARADPSERQQHPRGGIKVARLDHELDTRIARELGTRESLLMCGHDHEHALVRDQQEGAFDGLLKQRAIAGEHGELFGTIVPVQCARERR